MVTWDSWEPRRGIFQPDRTSPQRGCLVLPPPPPPQLESGRVSGQFLTCQDVPDGPVALWAAWTVWDLSIYRRLFSLGNCRAGGAVELVLLDMGREGEHSEPGPSDGRWKVEGGGGGETESWALSFSEPGVRV